MSKKGTIAMTELKMARELAGLTQTDVAEILKIDRNTVSNHEKGKVMVTIKQVMLYAKLYGVSDYRDLCPTPERAKRSV